jgi:hypothetical protein
MKNISKERFVYLTETAQDTAGYKTCLLIQSTAINR